MIEATEDFPRAGLDVVDMCLDAVDKIPPGGFVELTAFDDLEDGAGVERDSRDWMERIFRPGLSPYADGLDVRRFRHASTDDTLDLLWHAYHADDIELAVVEGCSFALVRARLADVAIPGPDDAASSSAIESLAKRVLALDGDTLDEFGLPQPYAIVLQYRPPIGDGSRFTSGPHQHPDVMTNWTQRLDAGIHDGALFFMVHKARQGDGRLISLNGRAWFSGKCWDPYSVIKHR